MVSVPILRWSARTLDVAQEQQGNDQHPHWRSEMERRTAIAFLRFTAVRAVLHNRTHFTRQHAATHNLYVKKQSQWYCKCISSLAPHDKPTIVNALVFCDRKNGKVI